MNSEQHDTDQDEANRCGTKKYETHENHTIWTAKAHSIASNNTNRMKKNSKQTKTWIGSVK